MEEWNEARERKSHSARCGNVKRRILAGEPLTGKTLAFALDLLAASTGFSDQEFLREIAKKLEKGAPLTDYEEHIVVDVILVHSKCSGPTNGASRIRARIDFFGSLTTA